MTSLSQQVKYVWMEYSSIKKLIQCIIQFGNVHDAFKWHFWHKVKFHGKSIYGTPPHHHQYLRFRSRVILLCITILISSLDNYWVLPAPWAGTVLLGVGDPVKKSSIHVDSWLAGEPSGHTHEETWNSLFNFESRTQLLQRSIKNYNSRQLIIHLWS